MNFLEICGILFWFLLWAVVGIFLVLLTEPLDSPRLPWHKKILGGPFIWLFEIAELIWGRKR